MEDRAQCSSPWDPDGIRLQSTPKSWNVVYYDMIEYNLI